MMFYNLVTNSSYFGSNVNLLIVTGPLAQGTDLSPLNIFQIRLFYQMTPILNFMGLYQAQSSDGFGA